MNSVMPLFKIIKPAGFTCIILVLYLFFKIFCLPLKFGYSWESIFLYLDPFQQCLIRMPVSHFVIFFLVEVMFSGVDNITSLLLYKFETVKDVK
jgi:hypothetical protein